MAFGELSQALTALPVPEDGGTIEVQEFASDVLAFEPGPSACRHESAR
jgi:hypothetical protein